MLDELHDPLVAHVVKEATKVRIEYPVHPLPLDAHSQCVERLMQAATGSKSVREAFEVDLINLIENRHHSLLNDFVLQRCDAQRALPPVGLRYIDSSRRSCPIRSMVYPAVKIRKPTFQPGFILLPHHPIYSGRCLPLQCEKAVPDQVQAQVVEQNGEPFLLPYRCCLPHTVQSCYMRFPPLRRGHVRLNDVLLNLCPFPPQPP